MPVVELILGRMVRLQSTEYVGKSWNYRSHGEVRCVVPNTKLLKKSTATEHAVSRLPLTWIQMFTSKHHAQLLLEKIVALLVWMAQDFQSDFKTDEIHSAAHEVLKSQI